MTTGRRERTGTHVLARKVTLSTGEALIPAMKQQAMIGAVLMVVGTVLFLPGLFTNASQLATLALLPAAALLTYGTYLVGTSEQGRAV